MFDARTSTDEDFRTMNGQERFLYLTFSDNVLALLDVTIYWA